MSALQGFLLSHKDVASKEAQDHADQLLKELEQLEEMLPPPSTMNALNDDNSNHQYLVICAKLCVSMILNNIDFGEHFIAMAEEPAKWLKNEGPFQIRVGKTIGWVNSFLRVANVEFKTQQCSDIRSFDKPLQDLLVPLVDRALSGDPEDRKDWRAYYEESVLDNNRLPPFVSLRDLFKEWVTEITDKKDVHSNRVRLLSIFNATLPAHYHIALKLQKLTVPAAAVPTPLKSLLQRILKAFDLSTCGSWEYLNVPYTKR